MEDVLIGEFIDEKCPRCGARLLANKAGDKWCSNAGGPGMSACSYGLEDDPRPEDSDPTE